jgi:hypothetical protein
MDLQSFEKTVKDLLSKRKMLPAKTIGLKSWNQHFLAQTWLAHCYEGDGFEMLEILADDSKLIGGDMFNQNFVLKFEDLYPEALKTNKAWKRVLPSLVGFKGKGLGAGELYLALVIQGWTFERTDGKGDGKVAGGIRELKNNGASLKPLAEAIRIQDQLNRDIFKGNRAGPVTKFEEHREWIREQSDPEQIYLSYFSKLYPGRDVAEMCKQLAVTDNGRMFYNIIGKEVLKWYKSVDNWNSLIIIDQEKMTIGNIADVNNLSIFKDLKFEWKSERGGDTQAITDGYVNIKI